MNININAENRIFETFRHETERVELIRAILRYPSEIDGFYENLTLNFLAYIKDKLFLQAVTEYDNDANPRKRFRYSGYVVCQDFTAGQSDDCSVVTVNIIIKIKRGKETLFSRSYVQRWDTVTGLLEPLKP